MLVGVLGRGAALAVAGGASPQYNRQTYTCSGVYCHGATLGAGGSDPSPAWTGMLGSCGPCHAAPPASHALYVNPADCSRCHGASVESDDATFKAAHLNGTLDFLE